MAENQHMSSPSSHKDSMDEHLYEIQVLPFGEEEEEELHGQEIEKYVEVQEENIEENFVISNTDNLDCDDINGYLVGVKKDSVEEMYKLYCQHARSVGFSVRKSTNRYYARDNQIMSKMFVCGCCGMRTNNESSSSVETSGKKRKFGITRTGCKASMLVKRTKDGRFKVHTHNTLHNHQLTRTKWNYLHRSERRITPDKSKAIEDMLSSGMRTIDSYRYLVHNAGGEENIGHTMKDHYNFVNRLKMEVVEGGDVNNMLAIMEEQESEEEEFFYRVRMNDDGRLASIFWRDSLMKEDYEIYGDVMVFDKTYSD